MPETPATPTKPRFPWFWILPIPVALGLGIVIGMQIAAPGGLGPAAAVTQESQEPSAATQSETAQRIDVERHDANDPTAVGALDAPVVMVTYSDYQCGYCAKWANEALPSLLTSYVESGQLRIEYRDIMFFGENSRQSAELAVAAGKQGKYQEFHDAIFAKGATAKDADYSEAGLKDLAERIDVDAEQFIEDAKHTDTVSLVQQNHDEANTLGVTGTPTFVINGRPIIGAQPLEAFVQVIDEELGR